MEIILENGADSRPLSQCQPGYYGRQDDDCGTIYEVATAVIDGEHVRIFRMIRHYATGPIHDDEYIKLTVWADVPVYQLQLKRMSFGRQYV